MHQPSQLERIKKDIVVSIENELAKGGILCQIFSRVKSIDSIEKKIVVKQYDGINNFLTDVIGIRIVLYFQDDINLVIERIKKVFQKIDETIDEKKESNFEANRINLLFHIPDNSLREFQDVVKSPLIKSSFEIQIRTILSEGWHEVDHDLRYKCKSDWDENKDLSRTFNGILASLETSEWSILSLFNQLSARHYKAKNLEALIRTKFRIRLIDSEVSDYVISKVTSDFIRLVYKLDRNDLVAFLFNHDIAVPLTMDNLVFIINSEFIKDSNIISITPDPLLQSLNSLSRNLVLEDVK